MTAPTPATTPRAPGRPAGDSPAQRERLLDVAVQAFAHDGIKASSLRSIAQQAGVTPALVNYYFGNKSKLLATVVEERVLPLLMALGQELRQLGDEPIALVSGFIQGMRRTVQAHPRPRPGPVVGPSDRSPPVPLARRATLARPVSGPRAGRRGARPPHPRPAR